MPINIRALRSPSNSKVYLMRRENEFRHGKPLLHIDDSIFTISINNEARGMVRVIGPGMVIWSNSKEEGRAESLEQAFASLGYILGVNSDGQRYLLPLRRRTRQ